MKHKRIPALIRLVLFCAGILFLFSCGAQPAEPEPALPETSAPAPETETAPEENEESETSEAEFPAVELTLPEEASVWAALYKDRFGEGSADGVILTPEEIAERNRAVIESCPTVVDLSAPSSLSSSELDAEIAALEWRAEDRYDREGVLIDTVIRDAVLLNRAADSAAEPENTPAVVVRRCDMKSLPTELDAFSYGDTQYSDLQLTELIVGMPVRILRPSADGAFLYVQCPNYRGWIPADACALCSEEDFSRFLDPESFATVVSPRLVFDGTVLDMGVRLPLDSEDAETVSVLLPVRDADGRLAAAAAALSKTDAVRGTLPYTVKNFFRQAFSCLGIDYGWGGADGGLDCSGFVCAVMRSFGFLLPRDTREQKVYAGEIRPTAGMTADELSSLLSELDVPAAIYTASHVMLYLGEKDGVHTVIHAPQAGEVVCTANFDPSLPTISLAVFH